MEHTGHVMLVGEGAERFAVAQGFLARESSNRALPQVVAALQRNPFRLVGTGSSRFCLEKTTRSSSVPQDEWQLRMDRMQQVASDIGIPREQQMAAIRKIIYPPTGTIHCSALNDKGEVSGVTTTSGLAWKLPGRCGDSPIIGAGCYTDQDVGSAGATGVVKRTSKLRELIPSSKTCATE